MKFNKKTLGNGLRIVTIPMTDNPTVTVLVMVETGSKYETKKINGLSHFLEHMCFKGTAKRPKATDLSRELDGLGSQYNAFTSQEFTGYYAKADFKHFDKVLDVVSDLYLNPTLPNAEIQKEKGVIIEEINMYQDLPQRHVQDLFMKLLYGDTPAGWNIAGTKENVAAMTRADFVKYRSEHYVAEATTVIVAGKIDEKDAVKKIEEKFAAVATGGKHKKVTVVEKQTKAAVLIQEKKTDQTHLVLGLRTFPIGHPKEATMNLLNTVLGGGMSSRLFSKLREEMGVGYYVKSAHDSYTDHGFLEVSTGVDKKRVPEVVNAIMGELRRFRDELVSPEELKKAKDYSLGTMYLSLESSDSQAEFYGYQEVLKHKAETPEAIAEKINKVTSKDIQNLARELFVDKHLNLALIGSGIKEKDVLKLLHF